MSLNRLGRLCTALVSCLVLLMTILPMSAFAAPTQTHPYGSITYSKSLKQSFFAFADSKVDAENQAWGECVQAGANAGSAYKSDCDSVVWVHNGYLSIAVSTNGHNGSGWGPTQARAEYFARQTCKSVGGKNCNNITTKHTSLNSQEPTEGGEGFREKPIQGTTPTNNYAGYAATGTQSNPITYKVVTATWKVPALKDCSSGDTSATWAGFTNAVNGKDISDLVQAGIASRCAGLDPSYFQYAFWQVYERGKTDGSHLISPLEFPVFPGNQIKVEIRDAGFGVFDIDLWNQSLFGLHWSKTVTGDPAPQSRYAAECIQEDPSTGPQNELSPLANFQSVTITCDANNHPIGSAGAITQKFIMNKTHTGNLNASGKGNTFTVDWLSKQ